MAARRMNGPAEIGNLNSIIECEQNVFRPKKQKEILRISVEMTLYRDE